MDNRRERARKRLSISATEERSKRVKALQSLENEEDPHLGSDKDPHIHSTDPIQSQKPQIYARDKSHSIDLLLPSAHVGLSSSMYSVPQLSSQTYEYDIYSGLDYSYTQLSSDNQNIPVGRHETNLALYGKSGNKKSQIPLLQGFTFDQETSQMQSANLDKFLNFQTTQMAYRQPETSDLVSNSYAGPRVSHHRPQLSISTQLSSFNFGENTRPQEENRAEDDSKPFEDLILKLPSVDASNVNNYLLSVLRSFKSPIPLDDFYLFLYNDKNGISNYLMNPKIDKTIIHPSELKKYFEVLSQILKIFRSPNILGTYYPQVTARAHRLSNINYHELLRTFLAIKILSDILIHLQPTSKPQNYTIPRLSIYKTYFIICQKFINEYPNSTNTHSEQEKLILGQSKLGKLLKLVYPDLLIKRLGSRGDSKYHYLGIVWNENIVNDEIKDLCDENELSKLAEIFKDERKKNYIRRKRNKSTANLTSLQVRPHQRRKFKSEPKLSTGFNLEKDERAKTLPLAPLSFALPEIKFPDRNDFTCINYEHSWFSLIKASTYQFFDTLEPSFPLRRRIQAFFLLKEELEDHTALCRNFMLHLIQPLDQNYKNIKNIDLRLYLIVITEILPFLLFVNSPSQDDFLKKFRLNCLYLINNLVGYMKCLDDHDSFPIKNAKMFCSILKKLININDLLITFLRFVSDDESPVEKAMLKDIKTYLLPPEQNAHTDAQKKNAEKKGPISWPAGKDQMRNRGDEDKEKDPNGKEKEEGPDYFRKSVIFPGFTHTCIAFNFNPSREDHIDYSALFQYISEDVDSVQNFLTMDLLSLLEEVALKEQNLPVTSTSTDFLSEREKFKLFSLLSLIHEKLLTRSIRKKYPIIICNNLLSTISNDTLKFIFNRNQKKNVGQNIDQGNDSFANWWIFNSIIQEYMSLMGEIVGLYQTINQ